MNLDLKEQQRRARLRIASVALQWYEADARVRATEGGGRAYHQAAEEEQNWRDNLRSTIEFFETEGVL